MSHVRIEQRNAHLAGAAQLEYVNGREGRIARATVTVISNARRGRGAERSEVATAILWTLWGTQAACAAEFLGKGSHINVIGRMVSRRYEKDGQTIYGYDFICEQIDYLDRRDEREARRQAA